jgi:sorbitol/mannitol transport system permease protein
VVAIVLVTQLPFVLTLVYSFTSWNFLEPGTKRFVGFANYSAVFEDPFFRQAAVVTIEMTVTAVLASLLLGLGVAVLLDRKFLGRGLARTLLITPFLVMPAAASLVWQTLMLDPSFGILDWFLRPFGGGHIDWVGGYPFITIVMTLAWQWTPFMMLIVLAGLQSQPPETLEAARVDGASARGIFVYMTLPHLRQYLELGIVLGSIYMLQAFDQVFLITEGGPGVSTTNLPYFMYERIFEGGEIGYGSAVGMVDVIATIIIAIFALRLLASLFSKEIAR